MLAALLRVHEGPRRLFVMGPVAGQADRVAAMIEDIEVIAIHPEAGDHLEAEGMELLLVTDRTIVAQR